MLTVSLEDFLEWVVVFFGHTTRDHNVKGETFLVLPISLFYKLLNLPPNAQGMASYETNLAFSKGIGLSLGMGIC